MGVGGQRHAPVAYPWERPGTHCTGGWVGPRVFWTGAENLAPPGFDPRTVQPVASRYTDCVIRAHPRMSPLLSFIYTIGDMAEVLIARFEVLTAMLLKMLRSVVT